MYRYPAATTSRMVLLVDNIEPYLAAAARGSNQEPWRMLRASQSSWCYEFRYNSIANADNMATTKRILACSKRDEDLPNESTSGVQCQNTIFGNIFNLQSVGRKLDCHHNNDCWIFWKLILLWQRHTSSWGRRSAGVMLVVVCFALKRKNASLVLTRIRIYRDYEYNFKLLFLTV